jgi:sugar lactone lactonase YvrE
MPTGRTPIPRDPIIQQASPAAALPGAEIALLGASLGASAGHLPTVMASGHPAHLVMCRSDCIVARLPEQARTGMLEVLRDGKRSNQIPLIVARQLSDGLHPVTSPAVSRSGMIFTTISGPRGKQTPVSIVRINPDGEGTPFTSGILNPTGVAIHPDGDLFVSSRAEGTIYRIDAGGDAQTYADGMGVATGIAFDADGNLFVGDRSGTIFKIAQGHSERDKQIFVFATLEPSVAAYHLAIGPDGTLFVTAPTLTSHDAIWAIDHDGAVRSWFRGLGRPQGLAVDADSNVYVAASLGGQRGLVRIDPDGRAELVVAGHAVVGVAFSPLGSTILTTSNAVFEVELGVNGTDV